MSNNNDAINNIWYRLDDREFNAGDCVDDEPHGATRYRTEGVPMAPNGYVLYKGMLLFEKEEDARSCNIRYRGKYIYRVIVEPTKIISTDIERLIVIDNKYSEMDKDWMVGIRKIFPYEIELKQYSVCLANDAKVIEVVEIKEEYDLLTQLKNLREDLLAAMGLE